MIFNSDTLSFLEENYSLERVNTYSTGRLVEDKEPYIVYELDGEPDLTFYRIGERSFLDSLHPYRPSGEWVIQVQTEEYITEGGMFLSARETEIDEIMAELDQRVDLEGIYDEVV